jgi:protein-L-isoaspartate(D-aspartate) O-methyltransferase
MDGLEARRVRMVRVDLEARGIRDPRVLAAFLQVPREAFVPAHLADVAYDDGPLPIGRGQTISQPFMVAEMIQALHLGDRERVLEVGTGSGYAAALLALIAVEVDTIERDAELARVALERLSALGCANVRVHVRDGTLGLPERAPFDAIVVAAGGPYAPRALTSQLAPGGRLVMPIGPDRTSQRLVRITRGAADEYATEDLGRVRFVPLVGEQGWEDAGPALS